MKLYNYVVTDKTKNEQDVDLVIGKKIISHLESFFKKNTKHKTRRRRTPSKKYTRKKM
jgi:hypothetical protein